MNMVAGVITSPVPVRRDLSLKRSKDTVQQMEAQGWRDPAVVLRRNLAISWGLCTVDALLLVLCVWEVLNFNQWEREQVMEEVPAQDWVAELEVDCFRYSVAK